MTRLSYAACATLMLMVLGILGASSVNAMRLPSPSKISAAAAQDNQKDQKGFAAQAARGKDDYDQQCSVCHQPDLSGSDMIPALAGDAFMARWDGKTAKDLYDRESTTMPSNAPGSLDAKTYLDLTAYILQANNVAAADELTADSLSKVTIHSK